MRIRTNGEYAYRKDTIEAAAERLGVNKTEAVLIACDSVGPLLDGVEEALEHPDIPPRLKKELANIISTSRVQVCVNPGTAEVTQNKR
ncbi:DUF7692 domain-containing protein [Salarchaeum japonicum]|uniref:DUF7692 domain-containing protein n=1 Tax=Salarchaeum japonicum TaxID=555573 RepID=A0AAV3T004_9EURY|nr:hypothetical protein [Salarchaeum japonicum]